MSASSSNYRQFRVTATHERGTSMRPEGRFSYSVYAKGLNQEWHEHQCLARGSVPGTSMPLRTTEDVVMALLVVLEEFLLPGIDPTR